MKRKIQEEYIDRILDHANTLKSLVLVDNAAAKKITDLHDVKTKTSKNEISSLYLLRSRIKIILPSFIADAQDEQDRCLTPEYLRTDAYRYRQLCSFNMSASDLAHVAGYDKLVRIGYFNRNNNPNGVVKDHRISINTGFTGKLAPTLIGHPCNCEFLTVEENSSKGARDSITITELMKFIEKWDGKKRRWREFN